MEDKYSKVLLLSLLNFIENLTSYLLQINDYSINQIESDIDEIIQKIKEWQIKREAEEEEKKEQVPFKIVNLYLIHIYLKGKVRKK